MKKYSFKQIIVIITIALILILNILAYAFAVSEVEALTKWAWICFLLSLLIPFFIFLHLQVLNIIRKTHERDAIKEELAEKQAEEASATDDETT